MTEEDFEELEDFLYTEETLIKSLELTKACKEFWQARKNAYLGISGLSEAKFALYRAMAGLWGVVETDCDPYRAPELHKDTCSCKLRKALENEDGI